MLRSLCLIVLLASFLSACNSEDEFKIGECIQEPDSIDIWKIADIRGAVAKLRLDQGGH